MLSSIHEPFKTMSAAFLMAILGLSGVGIIIWMAGTGWQDVHGIVLGVLFIALSFGQTAFGIIWYRAAKLDSDLNMHQECVGKEMSNICRSPAKEAEKVTGTRESVAPLLANRESANVVDVADVPINIPTQIESPA